MSFGKSSFQGFGENPLDSSLDEFEIIPERAVRESRSVATARAPLVSEGDRDEAPDAEGRMVRNVASEADGEEEGEFYAKETFAFSVQRSPASGGGGGGGSSKKAAVSKARKSSKASSPFTFRLRVRPVSVSCRLYGGCDFGPATKFCYTADGRVVRGLVGVAGGAAGGSGGRRTQRKGGQLLTEDLKIAGGLGESKDIKCWEWEIC